MRVDMAWPARTCHVVDYPLALGVVEHVVLAVLPVETVHILERQGLGRRLQTHSRVGWRWRRR